MTPLIPILGAILGAVLTSSPRKHREITMGKASRSRSPHHRLILTNRPGFGFVIVLTNNQRTAVDTAMATAQAAGYMAQVVRVRPGGPGAIKVTMRLVQPQSFGAVPGDREVHNWWIDRTPRGWPYGDDVFGGKGQNWGHYFNEGLREAREDGSVTNPYKRGSWQHDAWKEGAYVGDGMDMPGVSATRYATSPAGTRWIAFGSRKLRQQASLEAFGSAMARDVSRSDLVEVSEFGALDRSQWRTGDRGPNRDDRRAVRRFPTREVVPLEALQIPDVVPPGPKASPMPSPPDNRDPWRAPTFYEADGQRDNSSWNSAPYKPDTQYSPDGDAARRRGWGSGTCFTTGFGAEGEVNREVVMTPEDW